MKSGRDLFNYRQLDEENSDHLSTRRWSRLQGDSATLRSEGLLRISFIDQ